MTCSALVEALRLYVIVDTLALALTLGIAIWALAGNG